ncbi:G2/mitotic-specific cyclin-B1 isoform X1 [Salmo trutta]|uniref:G2/mitotic-specific cyclin-B1-like n=1 Tax=Salmo trutta TaxID=8032 RepID=A0A673XTI5_SALTR|nr:G2/mitotic-specific cyclin-B1-like isoform X1 [Salmo trutta]XP_029623137.1 G2/mitotic-specific cyclin-B1-like isoform X1 [Salmo trutta]XP_029623138.1 G2/mitotic-specific cyclin-B1-like isoform X1 [Salmo trutta]
MPYNLRSKLPVNVTNPTYQEKCAVPKVKVQTKSEENVSLPGKPVISYGLRSRVPLGNVASKLNNAKGIKTNTAVHVKPAQRKQSATERVHVISKENTGAGNCDLVRQAKHIPAAPEEPPSQEATRDEGLNVPQAFSHALLSIPDVDSADAGDSSLCSDYVKDIYAHLRNLEVAMAIKPCYLEGCDVTGSMRSILVDWLVQVQKQFKLHQETLYMTVGIIDRFLQDYPVPKESLQLVGVTAMLIASKYEEIAPPVVKDFAHTTDFTYSCTEIRLMEMTILKALNYELGRPPPVHFLRRAAKVGKLQPVGYGLAKYLLELTLLDYASVHYPPSLTAAAALALSSRILHDSAGYEWTPALQHYTGYTEVSLLPVIQCIAKMLERLSDGSMKQLSIKQKYDNVKLLRVSCLPELTSTRAYAYINKLSNSHC